MNTTSNRCAASSSRSYVPAGRDPLVASDRDWFVAAALALRDRIVERWLSSTRDDNAKKRKRVYVCRWNSFPDACC